MTATLAHGVDLVTFAKLETTFDTLQAFEAGDAVDLIDLKLEPTLDAREVKSHRGTASASAMVLGRKGGKATVSSYVAPNAAGTPPDVGALLTAAMGSEDVTPSTSVTYALTDTAPKTLQLARKAGTALYEVATGAWVEQMDLEVAGNAEAKLALTCGYASHGHAYACAVGTDGAASGATSVPLATAHKGAVGVGAVVTIGTSDGDGTGHTVTAVDLATNTITITPGLDSAVVKDAAIVPYAPTPSYGAGTVLEGIDCSLKIDTVAYGMISFKASLKTGHHGLDKIATDDRPTGVARGKRELTGELQMYFLTEQVAALAGQAWAGTTHALELRVGPNVAGKRMTITIPKAFFEVAPVEIPEADEATLSIKWRALMSSAAADEMTISFT